MASPVSHNQRVTHRFSPPETMVDVGVQAMESMEAIAAATLSLELRPWLRVASLGRSGSPWMLGSCSCPKSIPITNIYIYIYIIIYISRKVAPEGLLYEVKGRAASPVT